MRDPFCRDFLLKKIIQDSGVKDVVLSPNGHVEPH